MGKIIAISGSLRKGSYNTALLKSCLKFQTVLPIEIASIQEIPLYNGDTETAGIPAAVAALQDKFEKADGILIASPEYNNGIPGVLKNTIDWLSRPPDKIDKVFARKPLAMMGASMGGFGTLLAQTAWLPVIRVLKMRLWTDKPAFLVSRAQNVFDKDGNIVDESIQKNLRAFIEGFVAFVSETK